MRDEMVMALWRLYRAVDVWQQCDYADEAYEAVVGAYGACCDAEEGFVGSTLAAPVGGER